MHKSKKKVKGPHMNFTTNEYKIKKYFNDPLLKNSLYLMLTSISNAGFGFIFWMLAAKFYSKEDVGIATALFSSLSLLMLLSRFGLDYSIISFFPKNEKNPIFSTSALITTLFSIFFGIIYVTGIDLFSPKLNLLKSVLNSSVFLTTLAASSLISITGISFVALRKSKYYFFQSVFVGSRVIFLIPLIAFGPIGIMSSINFSLILALFISLIYLKKLNIKLTFEIDKYFLSNSLNFSVGNYISGLSTAAPSFILPIMVLNVLGPEQAANYYIVYSIAAFLFMIPNTVSVSLFVEGSNGEDLKKAIHKSMSTILSLLLPCAVILFFCGGWILTFINKDYSSNGLELLRIMIFSSFFVVFNFVYFSVQRIQKDTRGLVIISGMNLILLIIFGYFLMLRFGLIGIGYAWLISYGISSLVITWIILKNIGYKNTRFLFM